jgi:hypothetical protein
VILFVSGARRRVSPRLGAEFAFTIRMYYLIFNPCPIPFERGFACCTAVG